MNFLVVEIGVNTVTCRLKAGIMDPEYKFIAKQPFRKRFPAAMNTQVTIEVLLGYKEENGVICWVRPEAI
jgi:hypothetical protein